MDHTNRRPDSARPTTGARSPANAHRGPNRKRTLVAAWAAAGALGFIVAACGSSASDGSPSGGSGAPATGGSSNLAGAPASGGATAGAGMGTSGAAGQLGSGGTLGGQSGSGPGGQPGSAGSSSTAGSSSSGGTSGSGAGGAGAGAGHGGAATAGGGSAGAGSCQKGQTKPAEVVIMGESFYAIAPQYIQTRIQDDARKAGALAANATYRNVAVSGQNMNYIATTEWTAATQGGASVKVVIMDGGGIDCLGGGSTCSTCASTFTTLLGKMATAGVQDVVYTRYPEPGAPPGSNASLKACLDSTMPGMQTVCQGSTSPRCHWLDLRPVFVAGDTTDGLHPTQSGGEHVGDLIWSELVKLCLAQ